jgi:hypothetical protein
VRLLKCATPVKAQARAPAPSRPTSCAALTGVDAATRTGSRERGGGLRQTLDRQQERGESPPGRGRNDSGTAWATPLEQGGEERCWKWLPFWAHAHFVWWLKVLHMVEYSI